jgi:hypothetical protein
MIPDTNDTIPRQGSSGKSLLGTGLSRYFFKHSQYQSILDDTNNTWQNPAATNTYETILVLFGINKSSSIIANTIPVSSWYHDNMVLKVLSVWYHHNTDSGNFQKNFDA